MSLRVIFRQQAINDVREIVSYFDQHNLTIADQFIESVFAASMGLAEMPGKGSLKMFRVDSRQVRSWIVPGFRNYVIYYMTTRDAIIILAVLHGARSVSRIVRGR